MPVVRPGTRREVGDGENVAATPATLLCGRGALRTLALFPLAVVGIAARLAVGVQSITAGRVPVEVAWRLEESAAGAALLQREERKLKRGYSTHSNASWWCCSRAGLCQ